MNRQNTAAFVAVCGLGLLGLSFFWAGWRDGSAEWTDADASRYQQVSADLHRKSFSARSPEQKAELAALEADFESLKGRLTTASGRGEAEAFWLAVAGAVLLVGAIGLASVPQPRAKPRR